MDIDSRTLACWLDNAWDDAPDGPSTFRQQLRIMERNAALLFASGSIGSVSKNSASQSYAGAGFGRFSVAQIQQGYRMLIELYDQETIRANELQTYQDSAFVAKYPDFIANPEPAVYGLMRVRVIPVDDYQVDLGYLRLRPTLATANTW